MWKVTSDFGQYGATSRVGWYGGDHYETEMTEVWRTLSADGDVSYQGIASEGEGFNPLWDFAEGDVGDIEIQYLNKGTGEWETL